MLESLGFNLYIDLGIIIKMLCIIVSSILIGTNRGKQNQFAGLKTHLFVAIGAGLAFIVPEVYFTNHNIVGADPFRVSAQVISGIGFLGAGAIIKSGLNVRGLTTAASLWVTAVIAIAFASGLLIIGIFSTALVFAYLTFNQTLDPTTKYTIKNVIVTLEDIGDNIADVNQYMVANATLHDKPSILEVSHMNGQNVAIVAYEISNKQSKIPTNEVIYNLSKKDYVLKVESLSEMDKTNWRA